MNRRDLGSRVNMDRLRRAQAAEEKEERASALYENKKRNREVAVGFLKRVLEGGKLGPREKNMLKGNDLLNQAWVLVNKAENENVGDKIRSLIAKLEGDDES